MRLFYTPRSHFSRKVRILLRAWGVDVELSDVGNVADASFEQFGNNPLMKVPTLVDGDTWIVDSDHIARYLVGRHDPHDAFSVLVDDVESLNARAVMNGIMAAEVEVILARRTGIDTSAHSRFEKVVQSIHRGLDWLDSRVSSFPERPCYAGFHLVCMWDHLALYSIVELGHPRVREVVAHFSGLPYVAASAPS